MADINELLVIFASALNNIAHAIRAKTGKDELLSIENMATEQDAVFDAGKKAGTDAFWDVVQDSGNRTSYNSAFVSWGRSIYARNIRLLPQLLTTLRRHLILAEN